MNQPLCAIWAHWDGSHQCMVAKLEGDDYHPKHETFLHIASRDADPWLGISQTLHSFLSKENSKNCTHIFPHLANLFRKHKTPSPLFDNS
jgi:hypothetical protein